MNRLALAFAAVALLVPQLSAQWATNDAFFTMTINGVDGAPPNLLEIVRPGTITFEFTTQSQNVPLILAWAPGLSQADQVLGCVVQIDIGPAAAAEVLIDGNVPMDFLDTLGNTGNSGSASFTFPLGSQVPLGVVGAFQSLGVDFTNPPFVHESAAAQVTLIEPLDYGSITYASGTSTTAMNSSYTATAGAGTVDHMAPSINYDIEILNTNVFAEFISTLSGSIYRERDAAPGLAIDVEKNSSYNYIKTIYGDLYHFQDAAPDPDEFGFFIMFGTGAPIEIPGSRFNNPTTTGFSTTSPWETEVAIKPDHTTMAVVYDPSTGSDQIFLMKLDGTTFASTGTGVVDVTPTVLGSTTIEESSIRFTGNELYFVDSGGNLYGGPTDGSTPASLVTLPMLGTGFPAVSVDDEFYYVAGTDSIIIQAEQSTTHEDLMVIKHDPMSNLTTITNITNFAAPQGIEEWGDDYDGLDGSICASPDGSMVAFVAHPAGSTVIDDLYVVSTDGLGTPLLLTGTTDFADTLDTIIDLNMWSNTDVLFFCGEDSTDNCDLYNANISMPTVAYTNVTATSTETTAPFSLTGFIDPDGYFTVPGRMIFGRDSTQTLGPSAGVTATWNLVGVEYATLTAYNILGDEFSGATQVYGTETSSTGLDVTFAPFSDIVWFKSATSSTDEELFAFDAGVTGVAQNLTQTGGSGNLIDNITPEPAGIECLFSYRIGSSTADEEVWQGTFGLPGVLQITDDGDPSTDITDSSIKWLATGAPTLGFFFAPGTSSTATPTDGRLTSYSLSSNTITDIDLNPGAYHILAISYP